MSETLIGFLQKGNHWSVKTEGIIIGSNAYIVNVEDVSLNLTQIMVLEPIHHLCTSHLPKRFLSGHALDFAAYFPYN